MEEQGLHVGEKIKNKAKAIKEIQDKCVIFIISGLLMIVAPRI